MGADSPFLQNRMLSDRTGDEGRQVRVPTGPSRGKNLRRRTGVPAGRIDRTANRANTAIYTIDPVARWRPDIDEQVETTQWFDFLRKSKTRCAAG